MFVYVFHSICKGWSNFGSSHISEPAKELNSRAAPSVRGNTTAHLVQPQEKMPEEGKKKW